MKTLNLPFRALLFFMFISCSDKDKDNGRDYDFYIINENVNESLYHKVFDPPLQISTSENNSNYYSDSLDLDNNGVNDVCFESFLFKPQRWYSKSAQLTIVNKNIFIPMIWVSQAAYRCSYQLSDTVYYYFYQNDPDSCNDSSTVIRVDIGMDHLRSMELKDTIPFFNNDNFTWFQIPQNYGFVLAGNDSIMATIENGSQITGYQFTYNHQGIWNGPGVKYLVFKIEEITQLKYGWVKLEISESAEIKIFEIACFQKK